MSLWVGFSYYLRCTISAYGLANSAPFAYHVRVFTKKPPGKMHTKALSETSNLEPRTINHEQLPLSVKPRLDFNTDN
jgi:hypothetical protein